MSFYAPDIVNFQHLVPARTTLIDAAQPTNRLPKHASELWRQRFLAGRELCVDRLHHVEHARLSCFYAGRCRQRLQVPGPNVD